jgi:hypothetical protein
MSLTRLFPLTRSDSSTPPKQALPSSMLATPNPDRRFSQVSETFRSSIQAFVKHAEANVPGEHSISCLLATFHLQKRRMYDVTSVFTIVGSCEKISVDLVRWIGLSKIPFALRKMQFQAGADSPDLSLDTIISSCDLVSISTLTVGFLLCFLALRMATLDIRKISRYLSRKTGRRKSTLCKLYQIAHILEAGGVLSRSDSPGQVTIANSFFVPVDISFPTGTHLQVNPFRIDGILNHDSPTQERVILARRQEFFTELSKGSTEGLMRPPV